MCMAKLMSVPLCPLSKHGSQTRRQQRSSQNLKGLFNSTRSSSVFWHKSSSAEQPRSRDHVFIQHFWVKWKHVSGCSLVFIFCLFRWCCSLVQCVNDKIIHFIFSVFSFKPRSLLFILDSRGTTRNLSSARFYLPAETDASFYVLQKNISCSMLPPESHLGLCDYSILNRNRIY